MASHGERNYHHPFTPYDIQLQFMSNLYDCLDQGQIGIFESPTGTGKSLSLICGALTWLKDHQRIELEGGSLKIVLTVEDDDEPEWVVEHAKAERIKKATAAKHDLETRLARVRALEKTKRQRYEHGEPPNKRVKSNKHHFSASENEDSEFILAEYQSDEESDLTKRSSDRNDGLSSETLKLLEKAGMVVKNDEEDENVLNATTKIFFCSRTHSQLAQFVNEVRRVRIPIEDELNTSSETDANQTESIRLISLGARKNLCVNPSVNKLGNATAINEKCLELQQLKTSKDQKCKFLPNKENEVLITQFRDLALATIRDIEDLGKIGKETGICPYYASRATIGPSEIVTLPYPLLLQKSAREALDISLKGHVVIIDEAHNLVNSIEGVYSAEVSLHQLQQSRSQLLVYLQKFRNRLKGKNRVYVAQVVRLIDSLVTYLQDKQSKNLKGGLVEMTELMSGKGLDQVNLHKLCRYLQESKLARKVAGYVTSQSSGNPDTAASTPRNEETPVLMTVEALFHTLTNPAGEGKFFYEQGESGYVLRYMLLDPAHHFREVVEEARSVVLAGGTMSPMEDYINHLFPYSDTSSIRMISCGHVIPKENLLAFPLTATGKTVLDFTFDKRGSLMVMKELGQTVLSLANSVPDGLVVFFPSYQYLDQVIRCWSKESLHSTLAGLSILNELQAIKPVFQECKGINVDSLLMEYASAIDSNRGGLLLSVIGGKLSEGINFSDRLGRGVAVVGLPFPNSQSVEWKTKLSYIEHSVIARGGSSKEGKAAAQEYYENACMRAVNQSVGRAIRHKGDYACIALLDRRYATARIQAKLPGWIKSGLIQGGEEHSLNTLLRRVHGFFAEHERKGRTA